jgi:hypothetical protein
MSSGGRHGGSPLSPGRHVTSPAVQADDRGGEASPTPAGASRTASALSAVPDDTALVDTALKPIQGIEGIRTTETHVVAPV